MANQRLVDYINQNKRQFSIPRLKSALIQQGYNKNEVEEAARVVQGATSQKSLPSMESSDPISFFTFDTKTKDTMMASSMAMIVAEIFIFLGDFLFTNASILAVIGTIIYAALGGAIAGFLIAKLYIPIMDFIASKLHFLLPLCNSFFKLLFLPVVIGSIIKLILSILIGGFAVALGVGLGGLGGGILGGLIGSSIIFLTMGTLLFVILGRFIYAQFMIYKVGKYYPNYKDR